MAKEVVMPQLGESVDEGMISRWLKKEGESIEEMEPLLEVNTDKVDTEIPSPASGTILEIRVNEGTTVRAGDILALIGEEDEAAPSSGADGKRSEPHAEVVMTETPAPVFSETKVVAGKAQEKDMGFISPVVAKIANEYNIDLSQVTGTGMHGRITKKDVLNYVAVPALDQQKDIDRARVEEQPETIGQKAETQVQEAKSATQRPAPAVPVQPATGDEIIPLSPVRRSIAEHMVHSKHTSPHVTTVMEVDLSRIVAHREANKPSFARDGVRLTFTPYFISAIVSALKEYPNVNSSWTDEGIILHRAINIGMATSLGEEGLIVPVIKNADSYSLLGLARTVNDLAERARARKLQPDEVRGGTFTITNHGISGSLFATPIINQPQCGILGVGAVQKRVVVLPESDAIAVRPMAYISLTFDHRILDGASGDHFLSKVVEYLEDWS